MDAARGGRSSMIAFERKRKVAIKEFDKEMRQERKAQKLRSNVRMQSKQDALNKIDLELDDAVLGQMALPQLKDQMRRFKDHRVWDEAHENIVPMLKKVVLGEDIAAKYATDYAADHAGRV